MENIANTLLTLNYGLIFIWALRFGLILTIIGIFTTPKKKTNLKKIITTQQTGRMESTNPIVKKAEAIMEKKFFSGFRITDEKEYEKVQKSIDAAGGLDNATPQTIQFFRIMIPIILIIVIIPTYFINLQVQSIKASSALSKTEQIESIIMSDPSAETLTQLVGSKTQEPVLQSSSLPKANPLVILWLIILPLATYLLPDMYLTYLSKKKISLIKSEIPTFRTFAVSMLETKTYPVYDILQILVGSTTALKQDLMDCMNEYFVDSKMALKHLHDKVNDKEFHIVCNALSQAIDEDKETTLIFLKQQLAQFDTLKRLKEEEKIKKKSNYFVIVLGMPLVCILVIWFYPWFLDAMSVLGGL